MARKTTAKPVKDDPQAWISDMEQLLALEGHPGWAVLMRKLKDDAERAVNELISVEPQNGMAVEACQRRVKRYQWFADTIELLIAEGAAQVENEQLKQAETGEFSGEEAEYQAVQY